LVIIDHLWKSVMEQQFEQIREQQRASWNQFSIGWQKWDCLMMGFSKPMGNEIIRLLNPKDSDVILDVASGTGEPGLTIATKIKGGKVVISDLSENMIKISQENADRRGIENVETIVCDVCELPFQDNTFDAISCRFGFMFFPDMLLAAKEMIRVLKPGGRVATAVWDVPEKNFWVTAISSTINKNMNLSAPPPDAPGIFRCAKKGFIQNLFQQAGFNNTSETEVNGKLKCGSPDVYWNMMTEVAAPVVASLSKADDALKEKIKKEVYQVVNEKYTDGNIRIDSGAIVIYGEK
jgi:ubiquinone/menaquinone biosynthesis C-methylase UbiE